MLLSDRNRFSVPKVITGCVYPDIAFLYCFGDVFLVFLSFSANPRAPDFAVF